MKKDVLITLKGIHQLEDNEPIEVITEGQYYEKNGKYYISYKESEVTGFSGITTTLKVEGEKVTLMRFGDRNTQMIFEKGQKHLCCYETEYGNFTVGVSSNKVNVELNESGGKIDADYNLEFNNTDGGRNKFFMEFKEITNDKFI